MFLYLTYREREYYCGIAVIFTYTNNSDVIRTRHKGGDFRKKKRRRKKERNDVIMIISDTLSAEIGLNIL